MQVTSSQTSRRALRLGLALLALALLAGGWYAARYVPHNSDESAAANSPSTRVAGGDALATIMQGVIGQTRLWKGDPNSPVSIVEFGDFQ